MNLKLLLFLSLSFQIHAQFGTKQTVWNRGGYQVITFDLDGDGDQDIIETGNNRISWFRNNDGQGNFSEPLIISNKYQWSSTYASDVDGDGDLDIIGSSTMFWKPTDVSIVAWFENLDGLGSFGPIQEVLLEFELLIACDVTSMDIDNDGDMDILSGSSSELIWFENLNGLGEFSTRQTIASNFSYLTDVRVDDIDGDGDLDIVTGSIQDDQIAWFENLDGFGNFGNEQIIATNIDDVSTIDISDLNGDGYKDILITTWGSKEVSWFENTDGDGNFGEKQTIDLLDNIGIKVLARDIDNDGDKDVLSSSYEPPFGIGTVSWYENTNGDGLFGPKLIIHEEKNFGFTLFGSDIDNDNDLDVIGSSAAQIAWFENLTPLTIDNFSTLNYKIFPNPTNEIINIQSQNNITELKIFNQLGQLILSSPNTNSIDISSFQTGIYFIQIIDINGMSNFKKIIKE